MMIELTNIELIAPTLAARLADKTIYVLHGTAVKDCGRGENSISR